MAKRMTILVTGATGLQGGTVARTLLSKEVNVRVLTRFPQKAQDISALGAEVIRGDFEERDSLQKAIRGADAVFLMATHIEKGVKAEVANAESVISVCRRLGSPHIVYSSVCGANRKTGIPHFESKMRIEKFLKDNIQVYTILRPVWFMQNFESQWLLPFIQKGVLSTPILLNRKLQMIDVSDIGEFASAAILRAAEFAGQEIDLTGDEMTMDDIAWSLSEALGHEVRYRQIPEDEAEEAVGSDMSLMYRWFNTGGPGVDIEGLHKHYGITLTQFKEYLRRSVAFRKAA
ncbi:MAG: NmrA/HSCARG family protein [Deltaproteobacteria bacterium]|nr:NmrA/HSCARG family protein [Deltaproteobacteria bacterium]